VTVIDASGALYPSQSLYHALGNGCPNIFTYSVLFATSGVGNRDWWDYDGGKGIVSFAQIVKDAEGGLTNYRSVVDGYSYHHITTTFNAGTNQCEADSAGRVNAAGNEIIGALDWIFGGAPPGLCSDPCPSPSDAPDTGFEVKVNRLYQNQPNPFNPRTAIQFSVAEGGPVALVIYDVGGRLVKTLLNGTVDSGLHNVVWDGTGDAGRKVGSGIYWSQLKAGDYISTKKMVVLK
jgi:hypothetical protein